MTCNQTPRGAKCNGKMVHVRVVFLQGKKRNLYRCDRCGREVYGTAQ